MCSNFAVNTYFKDSWFLVVLGQPSKLQFLLFFLTNAFRAHFAVPIWTLAGEGSFCIEALLTGLTVMRVSFTFIHICVCKTELWKLIVDTSLALLTAVLVSVLAL